MANNSFPYIEVSGTSYEMGYQHGAQALELIKRYLSWIEKLTGLSRDVLCGNAMEFLPYIEALSPEFVEEIKGLSEGADISFEEALLCQVRGEAAQVHQSGCTAFALKGEATSEGQTLAGQNQDLDPEFAELSIILKVKPTDNRPQTIMFTFAGQLAYQGMNEHGLAQFANNVYDYKWRPGVSHYPLKRIMFEKRTTQECVEVLRAHRACSAANVVLADNSGNITDVEVRPEEGIAIYKPEHSDCIVHANHYITEEFAVFETNSLPDSVVRHNRMHDLIKENWGSITVETMKTILADHEGDPGAICRHGKDKWHSICGYIAEPALSLLHVRRGHGCIGTWHTYEV